MRTPWAAWLGSFALVAACGDAFTSASETTGDAGSTGGDAGGNATANSDGAQEATPGSVAESGTGDASPPDSVVPCGAAKTCSGATPVCCTGGTFDCAHVTCGCTTQLECANDSDCSGLTPLCCINRRPADSICATGHFVARCASACLNGGVRMCDPTLNRDTCSNGQCSNDSGDLSNVGLPASAGYGVCK